MSQPTNPINELDDEFLLDPEDSYHIGLLDLMNSNPTTFYHPITCVKMDFPDQMYGDHTGLPDHPLMWDITGLPDHPDREYITSLYEYFNQNDHQTLNKINTLILDMYEIHITNLNCIMGDKYQKLNIFFEEIKTILQKSLYSYDNRIVLSGKYIRQFIKNWIREYKIRRLLDIQEIIIV